MANGPDKLAEVLIEEEDNLRSKRKTWETHWQHISRFVIPREANFLDEFSEGTQRNRWVLDSTAPRSVELFASFLFTLLNNPATAWFNLIVTSDPRLNQQKNVKEWLEDARDRMLKTMLSDSSRLYSHLHRIYLGLGAFGTGILFEEMIRRGEEVNLRVRSYHLGSSVIAEGEDDQVDALHRTTPQSPRQIMQRFENADKLGPSVERATNQARHELIDVIHSVFPASDEHLVKHVREDIRTRGSPFFSIWVNKKDRVVLQQGTFEEFPYQVPRWYKTDDEVYGRSPAMTAMPDIRMVNRMSDTILRGAEKLVDPPLLLPDGGIVSPVRLFPGGLTFSEGEVQPHPLIPPGASRIDVGDTLLKQRQDAIREAFFVPLFITPESPVKTATQVLQEVDERNRATSPMLIRVQDELFHGLLRRVYRLMARAGLFQPAPPELENVIIDVEYISPLHASQLEREGLASARVFEMLAPWAQVNPDVFDAYDTDEVSQIIGAASGIPARAMRDRMGISRIRQARQEAAQAAQNQQLLLQAVEAGAKVTTAQAAQTRAEKS